MRRPALLVALVAVAVAVGPAHARETAVGVELREFSVGPYRDTVRPGVVKLNVENFGEDPHDLVVRRRGVVVGRLPELRPGERATLRVRLRRRGRYVLACTVGDHEARGMRARLTVKRRRR